MRLPLEKYLKLCLITHIKDKSLAAYKDFLQEAVRGGVTMVQLREKTTDTSAVKAKALELQNFLKPLGIPFILNDFVELAAQIDADGVHLGQQDMHVLEARSMLGPHKIIGLSLEKEGDLAPANAMDAIDYVTVSAVFPSSTKPECKTIWGLEGLKFTVQHSKHPVTAIGGITPQNVQDVWNTKVQGIAVIGAIHNAQNPYIMVRQLTLAAGK